MRRWGRLLLVLFALTFLPAPAAADYLGPDRVRTVLTPVAFSADEWIMVRWSDNQVVCKYYLGIPPEANDPPQDTCAPADFDTLANTPPCLGNPAFCPGYYSQKVGPYPWMETITSVVIDPPATVSAALIGCSLQNGWCVTPSTLRISGSEPVAGYQILGIEGVRNAEPYYCAAPLCDVPLGQGTSELSFWALSSYGDTSEMGHFQAQVDTVAPYVTAQVSGVPGENGWFVSVVTVVADGDDPVPGSGLAVLEVSADAGPWMPYAGPYALEDGIHSLSFRATDQAGLTGPVLDVPVMVDSQPPTLSLPATWVAGEMVPLLAGDDLSGLAQVTVTILDPAGVHPPRVYGFAVSPGTFLWDGTFGDGWVAAGGDIPVLAEARDLAGNLTWANGIIRVPQAAPAPAADLSAGVGSLQPPVPAVPGVIVLPVATRTAVVRYYGDIPTPAIAPVVAPDVDAGAMPPPGPGNGILWGAAALAASAVAMAGLLRLRQQRLARQAAVNASVEKAVQLYNSIQQAARTTRESMRLAKDQGPQPKAPGGGKPLGKTVPIRREVTKVAPLALIGLGAVAVMLGLAKGLGGAGLPVKSMSAMQTHTFEMAITQAYLSVVSTATAKWTPTSTPTVHKEPVPDQTQIPAQPGATDCTYMVAQGDTLVNIARRFGVDPVEIQSVNHLTNPNLIMIGQVLRLPAQVTCNPIPKSGTSTPSPDADWDGISRGPFRDYNVVGWEHGEDENHCGDTVGCTHIYHPGVDIASTTTIQMYSNTSGRVWFYQYKVDGAAHVIKPYDPASPVQENELGGFGNFIVMETWIDGVRYCQVFAHMAAFSPGIESGDYVVPGTPLGSMGSTGNSSGPHVHWEVRTDQSCQQGNNGHFPVYYPSSQQQLDEFFIDPEDFMQMIESYLNAIIEMPIGIQPN